MPREKVLCGKENIIETALRIVDEKGIEALSIRVIASELKISPMTLYNYVENLNEIKKMILISGFDMMYSDMSERLKALTTPASRKDFCLAVAGSILSFATNNRKLYAYMFSEGQRLFCEDPEIKPFYVQITNLAKRSRITREYWKKNPEGYRLLELTLFSVCYQIATGASTITPEECAHLLDFYVDRCIIQ